MGMKRKERGIDRKIYFKIRIERNRDREIEMFGEMRVIEGMKEERTEVSRVLR